MSIKSRVATSKQVWLIKKLLKETSTPPTSIGITEELLWKVDNPNFLTKVEASAIIKILLKEKNK